MSKRNSKPPRFYVTYGVEIMAEHDDLQDLMDWVEEEMSHAVIWERDNELTEDWLRMVMVKGEVVWSSGNVTTNSQLVDCIPKKS